MARSAAIGTLIDELIVTITRSDKTSATFPSTKKRCDAILKDSSTWNRTDPFAIEKHLDGLQEKFRILNKDDLADALGSRLSELDGQRSSWTPELLSLLLQLSDRPANVYKVPKFESSRSGGASIAIKWSEIDAAGSEFADEDIWDDIDYGAASSDSESSLPSSDVSIPRILPQRTQPLRDEFVIPDELLSCGDDDELITIIKSGHFWEYDSAAVREFSESHTRFVTELQAVREILFMLQGLPTSLFWNIDNSIAVDRRYALSHASNSVFLYILRSCADIGVELGKLRKFVQIPQSVVFLQTFTRGVEKELAEFDAFLSQKQLSYLSSGNTVTVSLLQLTEEVQKEVRVLLVLGNLVTKLGSAPPEQSFLCLDLLYNLVCINQASGNEHEYRSLAKLFFSCFEAYARPLRLWLESGDLESSQDHFFITDRRHEHDLQTVWHDWYLLRETSGHLHAPIFIKPSARRILTTGKSMVFLQKLNVAIDESESTHWQPLKFEAVCPDDTSWQLLPFSSLLDQAVENLISTNHILASSMLRDQLNKECGLWTSLSALQYIYLCKDVSVSAAIDSKIFESLDRRGGVWNDRYLLTELVQSAFGETDCVDTSRLIVRSARNTLHDFESQSRKVKILKSISIDYVLPWPVANIITKPAMNMYQRISTFLMQIRRAKYILERQRLLKKDYTGDNDDEDDGLSYIIRHNLLWFANTLYGHITDMVIATNTTTMEKTLAESPDIDGMISVHESYMSSIEEQCFLSHNLAPIYQAIINLLDLCIHFADIQAARHGDANRYDTSHRSSTALNGQRQQSRRRRHRRRTADSSDSEDEDHNDHDRENDDDEDYYDEGNTTSISFIESSYSHRLEYVMRQFHRSLAFVIAGLRGVGRVDGQQSWDILADRLSWNAQLKR
ncbi:gamma-tubulin complex component GCP5, putative [Talaromyces stipitatus ATCC 10500]|uniref:Spindle pole body component n=1 Tax=Talaromyces stipitatus (strain ATCC 10500 / CBS 375.48 / QM 6759 / NRRL 1006) TaxID=441959 RepID=B8MAR1_TALSN|nr:gamma-tubulin complex component GCP5, putative [Talaromyces stipitatus ATCC 10500]EED17751.1 gamma-tubulin complex component GCP5, putative [Talaromyces stipitatus ATCC 10500]